MRIRGNSSARPGVRANAGTMRSIKKNLEKLSSGLNINRAADDAAGLSVSEKMRANITEAGRCQTNVLEGLDLTRTADGALAEINDMLCRAKKLCLEAENSTYDEQERASISEELNELFDEIDRITASSKHNTILLFREDGGTPPVIDSAYQKTAMAAEPETPAGNAVYSGVQEISLMGIEGRESGVVGEIDFIQPGEFDPAAPPAQAAAVTFRLAAGIDMDNVDTLEGRSIQIGDNVFYFTKDASNNYTPYYSVNRKWMNAISLNDNTTFESVMQALVNSSSDISGYSLDRSNRTVTLTAAIDDLVDSVVADGQNNEYFVKNGDGTKKNGMVVTTPAGYPSIEQVDGKGNYNNQPAHSQKSNMAFNLNISAALTADDITNLGRNKLYMNLGGTQIELDLKDLGFQEGMTKEKVGEILAEAFVKAINTNDATKSDYKCDAKYNAVTGKVDIGIESPTGKSVSASFWESSPPPGKTETKEWSAVPLNMSITRATSGSVEQGVTIYIKPQYDIDVTKPFAFFVGAGSQHREFVFYDSTEYPFGGAGYDDWSLNPYISDGGRIDVAGKSEEEIKDLVADKIVEYAKTLSYVKTAVVNADKTVTLIAYAGGSEFPTAGGLSVNVSLWKNETAPSGGFGNVLGDTDANSVQQISVSFDLGNDIQALVGKGFRVSDNISSDPTDDPRNPMERLIEFTNGSSGKHDFYTDVDISQCTTFEQVRQKLEDALNDGLDVSSPSHYEVRLDSSNGTNTVTISATVSNLYVTDGELGLIDGGPVPFSGGTKVGYSQKALDFSSITQDNLDTLVGKGFRIHCATCEGEYINVYFCNTKDDPLPPEMEGVSDKVHNVLVELSKVTDGSKIVEEIVKQISPELNHYTEVLVDPGSQSTLIVRDKRLGDYTVDGKVYRGRISTGIKAPDPETPEPKPPEPEPPEPEPPEPEQPEPALTGKDIRIYVGSHAEDPYIHIHLPNIDLEWLGLAPPRVVDLNEQDPLTLMENIDRANITISDVRGTIGAEYNRLEHAWQDLSQAEIQLTDAESRIRDADIAKLLMDDAKLQILNQSQQSMIAQANSTASQVLQLLG